MHKFKLKNLCRHKFFIVINHLVDQLKMLTSIATNGSKNIIPI